MPISLQKSNQLKAIAILMMLCLHLFNRDYHGLFIPLFFIGEQPLSFYISLFCDACVPIFAFVSGYGLYHKFLQDKTNYAKSNMLRLKKLYVNYWIVLILFAVILGWLLQKSGYPGSWSKFLLNFSGVDTSYNGAWWFFTVYVLFVLTSEFWFQLLERIYLPAYLLALFVLYLIAFYFRIYKPNVFENSILHWMHRQLALYFSTLFQFMLGAFALKCKWNTKITYMFSFVRHRNSLIFVLMLGLVVFHAVIPNLIIAPFTAIGFIFLFVQLRLNRAINRFLDYMSPHSTNLWLIHMFFYMIFFKSFVYGFQYPILIFVILVAMCVICSYVINFIQNKIIKVK
jgi:hypothetical protein